jgi:hypothetical protein
MTQINSYNPLRLLLCLVAELGFLLSFLDFLLSSYSFVEFYEAHLVVFSH